MSLSLMTPFIQTDGYAPPHALTIVEKADDEVNKKLVVGDSEIKASTETLTQLVKLRDVVRDQGMSVDTAQQLMELAPEAMPVGYGVESFTKTPSKYGLSAGMEGIISTIVENLTKLIKFIIERIKSGIAAAVTAYDKLRGVAPSAYKLQRRLDYQEALIADLNATFGSGFIEDFEDQLKGKIGSSDEAIATISALFGDVIKITPQLETVMPIIENLNKEVSWMTLHAAKCANMLGENLQLMSEGKRSPEAVLKEFNKASDHRRLERITGDIRTVCDVVVKAGSGFKGKSNEKLIEGKLNEKSLAGMLSGLTMAMTEVRQIKITPNDAENLNSNSTKDLLSKLANLDVVDGRVMDVAVKEINKAKVPDLDDEMTEEKFIAGLNKFSQYTESLNLAVAVTKTLTAQYAEVVLKLNNIMANRNNLVIKIWRDNATDKQHKLNEEASAKIIKSIEKYLSNVARRL